MKVKKFLPGVLGVILLLFLDQITKYWAIVSLKNTQGISLISDVFRFQYLENHGAAFGILQNQRWFLLVTTILVLVLMGVIYGKLPDTNRYAFLRFVGILIAAGAVGNMIDRIYRGYVIDFLYFELIDFPIFNVADCYVVIAAFLAFFLVCFYYKDEDFDFLKRRKQKNTQE